MWYHFIQSENNIVVARLCPSLPETEEAVAGLLELDTIKAVYLTEWQKFLRDRQPKTLIFWGQNDIFFTREGGYSATLVR